MAPPFGLTFLVSRPMCSIDMTACDAKAVGREVKEFNQLKLFAFRSGLSLAAGCADRDLPSLSSYRSTSSFEMPARCRTLGMAKAGPIPMRFGSTPTTVVMQNLPRIGRPSS